MQEVLHASDGFQVLLAISLAGLGASIAAAVALAAGALHPIAMYLILCGLLAGTLIPAIMTIREYGRYRAVRARLLAGTVQVPVPVLVVTPGAPSFTVGGQSPITGLTAQGLVVPPPSEADTSSPDPFDTDTDTDTGAGADLDEWE